MVITRKSITMRCPDNWHAHFRQELLMEFMVTMFIISGFIRRVLAMPNTKPPILTGKDALKYRKQITRWARKNKRGNKFNAVAVLQITEKTTPAMIFAAYRRGVRRGKVYPRYVTTNSEDGVVNYDLLWPVFTAMEQCGMILLLHGEAPSYKIEGLRKEKAFLTILRKIAKAFPRLKIVLEHITTAAAVRCVLELPPTVAATITVHHLLYTVDDVIGYSKASGGKGQGDLVCKPSLKFRRDRAALRKAAMSGNPKFFYGGDDAPHYQTAKHCRNICCGVFNTLAAIPSMIELFLKYKKLEMLEGFLSEFGAKHHGVPLNKGTVTFVRESWEVPEEIEVPGTGEYLTNMRGGEVVAWKYKPAKRAA
ncbi:MAG: dihydroorotase [Patescibacteria group bacterium]